MVDRRAGGAAVAPAGGASPLNAELVQLHLLPEEEAVLLCARDQREPATTERLARLMGDPSLDWPAFWALAGVHEVVPLAARAVLSCASMQSLPDHVVEVARQARLSTVLVCMAAHGELLTVAAALRARDIPVVPLKGTHLAQRLYGALDARRPGDIDVLVPESHLESARAELRRLGYAPMLATSHGIESHSFHGVPYVKQASGGTFMVELHWGLSDARFVTVDYPYLWQRVLATADGRSVLSPLPAEETLLFLALHHAKHDRGVLRLLADVDRLLRREGPSLDWDLLLSLAASWHVSGLLDVALGRAQLLLDSPVPREVLRRLRRPRWNRALIHKLTGPQAILRPPAPDHLRANQFRLAYCAMLDTFSRAARAYFFYLFTSYTYRGRGNWWHAVAALEGACRGVAWTAILLARSTLPPSWWARSATNGLA
jgi:hypothetical protein